jgi:hypothetical protein
MSGGEIIRQYTQQGVSNGYITQTMFIGYQTYRRSATYVTDAYVWETWRRLVTCEDLIYPPSLDSSGTLTASTPDYNLKGNTYITANINNNKDILDEYAIALNDTGVVGCTHWDLVISVQDNPNAGCYITFSSVKGAVFHYPGTSGYIDPSTVQNISMINYQLIYLPVGTNGKWVLKNEIFTY